MWSRIAQSGAADSDSEERYMGKRMLQGVAETELLWSNVNTLSRDPSSLMWVKMPSGGKKHVIC